jgi:hypothetical protein
MSVSYVKFPSSRAIAELANIAKEEHGPRRNQIRLLSSKGRALNVPRPVAELAMLGPEHAFDYLVRRGGCQCARCVSDFQFLKSVKAVSGVAVESF